MDLLLEKIKKPSKLVSIILFYTASALSLIYAVGNFTASFLTVIGTLAYMFTTAALWAAIPTFLILKKDGWARIAFYAIGAFWMISSVINLFANVVGGIDALENAISVFSFFTACGLIGAVALYVISCMKKLKQLKILALFVFLGTLSFYVILGGLLLGFYGKYFDFFNWNVFVDAINQCWVIPFAIFFGILLFVSDVKPDSEKAEESLVASEDVSFEVVEDDAEKSAPEQVDLELAETSEEQTNTEGENS